MAVITQSTFNPLKAHCNVRLQQGVPIVDADWNELDDIRKFQLRSYLRWFVGDGIPNDGAAFRIDAVSPTGAADDFIVKFGGVAAPAGTSNFDQAMSFAGRAIVDGMDVMILADVNYKAQPLFAAAGSGAPVIVPIPAAALDIAVYLDVWERLVTAQEDPTLVLSGVGTESCSRIKREWCVRTRAGKLLPKLGDADFIKDHSYYLLASINRAAANAPILAANIQDQRHVRLSLAAVESRLAALERQLLVPKFVPSPNQFNPKLGLPSAAITLFGKNFDVDGLVVKFGNTVATTSGVTGSQLVAAVPAGLTGPLKITIQTNGGVVTSDDNFTAVAPSVPTFDPASNQFNPKFGAPGASIELRGSNFNLAAPTVRFGSTPATIVGTPTATRITVTVPTMAQGATKITVQTSAGSVISDDAFTVTS